MQRKTMQNNINRKAKLLTICTLLLAAGCTRTPVKNAGINYAYMDTTAAENLNQIGRASCRERV